MKARLVRPLILFPYKSLKSLSSSNFDKFTAMTLKLQEVVNFGIFFHVMQTIRFITIKIRTRLFA